MQWTHFISNGQKQFNKCVLLQIERFSRHKNYDFMSTPCAPSVLYIPVDYMQFTMSPKSFWNPILIFISLQFLELFSEFLQQSYVEVKVCIIRLVHICFEKSSSTFWQVCCAHRTWRSCQKHDKDFFKFCGLLRKPTLYLVKW